MEANRSIPAPSDASWSVEIGSGGRIVIPVEARNSLGIKPGTRLRMYLDGGCLVVTTPEATLAQLREDARRLIPEGVSVVDELLADRRAEATREFER